MKKEKYWWEDAISFGRTKREPQQQEKKCAKINKIWELRLQTNKNSHFEYFSEHKIN